MRKYKMNYEAMHKVLFGWKRKLLFMFETLDCDEVLVLILNFHLNLEKLKHAEGWVGCNLQVTCSFWQLNCCLSSQSGYLFSSPFHSFNHSLPKTIMNNRKLPGDMADLPRSVLVVYHNESMSPPFFLFYLFTQRALIGNVLYVVPAASASMEITVMQWSNSCRESQSLMQPFHHFLLQKISRRIRAWSWASICRAC